MNRSGGPRTPEGKKRSSLNALKHGFSATSPQALEVLAERVPEEFESVLEEVREHYQPQDRIEEELVRRIARCVWRLSLASDMEERIITRNPTLGRPSTSYEKIMKFERLVDIHLHRAIHTLETRREEAKEKKSAGNFSTYGAGFGYRICRANAVAESSKQAEATVTDRQE